MAIFRSSARCSARTSSSTIETELVIIVTPYLVKPTATALATPLDGWVAPHDVQQVLWGDTWQQGLPAKARGPLDSGGAGLIGPAGFRLD